MDQLNTFCTVIASDATTKEYLELDDNRLWDVQPSLLAQAVIKFRLVILDRGWKRCAKNFVAHGVALFNALGESSSCTMDLNLSGFDLSGVDPDVMAKQIVKLVVFFCYFPGLTSEQKSAISTAVSDDNCNPSYLEMSLAQLQYVRQFESVCDEIERESSYFTRWRCSMLKERFIPLCFKT